MRIAANLGVKDEVELIDKTIAHLQDVGVDVIIASDMGSTDGTLEILERHRSSGNVFIIQFTEETTTQEWSKEVLETVKRANVDWVTFIDADEYILPATGSLKDCAALELADVVTIDRFNVPLTPFGPRIPDRIVPSHYSEVELIVDPVPEFRSLLQADPCTPWIRGVPSPKLLARPEVIAAVPDGAHFIVPVPDACLRSAIASDVLIAHLPFTSRARFARKVDNIRRVFELHDEHMGQDIGWHWRRWLASANEGHLDKEFERNVFSPETIALFSANGVVRSAAEIFRDRLLRISE